MDVTVDYCVYNIYITCLSETG